MKKTVLISIVILLGVFLSACRQRNIAETPSAEIVGDVSVQEEEASVEEFNSEDESEENQLEEESVADGEVTRDTCIECHTDQQELTDTAKPEEPHESESEGEG